MSTEVVSFVVVKELISTQERAFRQTVEMFATNMKKDINSIRKTVDDLKCSLTFSQRDIDDIKFKLYKPEEKVFNAGEAIFNTKTNKNIWRIIQEEITLRFLVFKNQRVAKHGKKAKSL